MSDILCVICGEPYEDYYVIHDMTAAERERLLSGKGCECCKGVVPKGRTADDQVADFGHNLMESEDPDTILDNMGL